MTALIIKSNLARMMFGLLLGVGIVVSIAPPAAARTSFDGLWSVQIVTEQGGCDRGYRYPVAIVNGAVRHATNEGDPSFIIAGNVTPRGAVRVTVRRGDQFAEGSGRLSLSTGGGRWRSQTGGCSGYWTAERRR
jgi:hypothetical protein